MDRPDVSGQTLTDVVEGLLALAEIVNNTPAVRETRGAVHDVPGVTHDTARVNGLKVHYAEAGTGPLAAPARVPGDVVRLAAPDPGAMASVAAGSYPSKCD